mmetsp:Transcript_4528/g.13032  ORF Transcript_4528/g.13032 Transcript_4528/m.13032 type:complete len:308 (-) Transcript_4528:493-1416(-)
MTELDQERTKEYFVKSECLKQRYRSGFVRTRDPSIHPIQRSTLGATRLYTALHYTTLQTMHTPHPTTPLTPSLSASASRMGKLSPLLIPLPPLTTMLALDRSGRSDFETDSPIHSALSKCSTTPSRVSTSTDEASTRSALSKQVGRTDRTLRLDPPGPGLATTLPSTLPAYIGRIKVCSSSISKTSVTGDTSSSAAARGTTVLPNLDWVPTTKTHSSSLSLSPSTTALTALATVSLSLSSMGTCRTLETPSGTLFGGLAPTTRRRMALLWPSSLAAVTVDRVPAGVDPSASRGSEMTRVEARRRGCC